jgi:hypothetical protein
VANLVVLLNLVASIATDNLVVLVAVLSNTFLVRRVAVIRRVGHGTGDVGADVEANEEVGALC